MKHKLTSASLIFTLLLLSCGLFLWHDAGAATPVLSDADFPIQVAGAVHNDDGEPLLGVSVRVKGRTKGTITNINGYFEVTADTAAVLVFSYIGYVTREIPVSALTDPTDVTIVLQPVNKGLSEVVVIGYGEKKREDLTGAVSTLDMDKVAPIPVQSINDAVAGRIPGLFVTTTNGEPGTKSQLSIRGGDPPLFIIDGVVRSQSDFENLNPNDIEKYSVLKDAAATSVYGAQGGNGVILVTTKTGKAGQVRVNYSFNQIWSQPTFRIDHLNAYQYYIAKNKIFVAENKPPLISEAGLKFYRDSLNVQVRDLTEKNFAPEQRHDLSLSLGNKLLTYFGSLSYYDQGTILKTKKNYNRRLTYRMNTKSNFEKIGLQVTTGIDGYTENFSTPRSYTAVNANQIFGHIENWIVINRIFTPLGLPTKHAGAVLDLAEKSGYYKRGRRSFNGRMSMNWTSPVKGLSFQARVNYGMWDQAYKSWNRLAPYYVDSSTVPVTPYLPDLRKQKLSNKSLTLQGYVNYDRWFGDHTHHLHFTGIYEQWQWSNTVLYGRRKQFTIFEDQFFAGPTLNQETNGSEAEAARAGYIGRFSYDYKSKYSLDVTMRYDGNDLFPPGKQWGLFYALSGKWLVTKEKFMQPLIDKKVLNYLKIRGSYGVTGKTNGIRRFQYVPGYTITPNAYVVGGVAELGISEGNLPSTDYSWYSIDSRNLGLDFGAVNDHLSGSFDYFYMRTSGFVEPDTRYGAVLGKPLPYTNSDAARRREGFEFNVTWKGNAGDITYALGFNFSKYNKLWEKYPGEDETSQKDPYTRLSNADDSYLTLGYMNEGVYQKNADLLEGPRSLTSLGVVAGDLKYRDTNGDGKIDQNDRRRIGSSTFPHVNYGFTIDFGYKAFYLSAVIMGSGNRDRYLGSLITSKLQYEFQTNYWTPDNTGAPFPRAVSSVNENGNNNQLTSDYWILKSRYIRLKYLQLGYNLKTTLLENSPFETFKVFISGTNLLTRSKSLDYFIDPEANANNTGYPIQRTFALGINVGF